jgi:hypothetical protein
MNKEYYMAEFNGLRSKYPLTDEAMTHYLSKLNGCMKNEIIWWASRTLEGQIWEINNTGETIVPKERKHGRI